MHIPNRRFFFMLIGFYTIVMQTSILLTNKGMEILYFCHHRDNFWTEFFKVATLLGEWISLVGLGIYLLIRNRKALLSALIGFIPIYLLLIFLKKTLDYPRPLIYFKSGEISPIPDFKPLYYHSMPSGHTFTAFFCASFIILYFSMNRMWQLLIFILAILVGLSRIYLMCHFKEDVFIGSILGIIAAMISVALHERRWHKA